MHPCPGSASAPSASPFTPPPLSQQASPSPAAWPSAKTTPNHPPGSSAASQFSYESFILHFFYILLLLSSVCAFRPISVSHFFPLLLGQGRRRTCLPEVLKQFANCGTSGEHEFFGECGMDWLVFGGGKVGVRGLESEEEFLDGPKMKVNSFKSDVMLCGVML